MSQNLADARAYEKSREHMIAPEDRPVYHLTPRVGWMNDPNGFSYYKGQYHMFYQYHPYNTKWGPMHWGHAVSDDMLTWEHRPCALAPDENYDYAGCFSGSAITLPDGRQLLMYTGVQHEQDEFDDLHEIQVQCLAIGDGTEYTKYGGNPVLTGKDLPEGGSRFDFRDPKMWLGGDGLYRCVIGNRPADKSGQILLYTSEDAIHWTYKKVLASNRNRIGKMWECPDFFVLDGKAVLLTSPQDMEMSGLEYRAGNGSICLIGSYDEETDEFTEEHDQAVDYGIDFYAHQTVLMPDGRRVMIGWMQNWDTLGVRKERQRWYGQMSLPREISVKNNRLIQQPIRELENYRTDCVSYEDVLIDGDLTLKGIEGRYADIELELSADDSRDVYQLFEMYVAERGTRHSTIRVRPEKRTLSIDRRYSGVRRAVMNHSKCYAGSKDGSIRLRIILDRNSVEVFADDGEKTMTMAIFTDPELDGISFTSVGRVRMNIKKYTLKH